MKRKILFVGAGAIGRGYLPLLFSPQMYDFVFVDSNPRIIERMRDTGSYTTFRVRKDQYEEKTIPVAAAFTPDQFRLSEHTDAAACFFSVGPRNVSRAAAMIKGLKIPLILSENEPNTVDMAKSVVGHEQVYFAVPDVITSNTAPQKFLDKDPLAIVTEDGVMFIEEGPNLTGDFKFLTRDQLLGMQWTPKLYLHNTPHCIAAYLGALVGVTYVHEAMSIPKVDAIVVGAMMEMLKSLKMKWEIPHDFLEWYAEKELARFRCKLLFDPVARVAREPMRKLGLHGRLIGAAQICLALGIIPQNILAGITGALLFEDQNDPDHHLAFLRRVMSKDSFNTYILGLRTGEPLDLLLCEQIDMIIERLQSLSKEVA
ncbi:MAG: mannitol-1-phosphate 5-dehydrogenase [Nitrospirota bacterium]